MSRSYKRYGYYRKPRGRKQAIVRGDRNRAIPPDAWDDKRVNNDCYIIHKIAFSIHKKGVNFAGIIRHLKSKYKLSDYEARRVVGCGFWPCDCAECNQI